MKKLVLLFPGQGSQYVGMTKSFESKNEMDFFVRAEKVLQERLGQKISFVDLCTNGPAEQLNLTQNTQCAILAHSAAYFQQLKNFFKVKNFDFKIANSIGHSVGEYSLLTASECLSFEDAIYLVANRGRLMQEAVPVNTGKMVALLKVPLEIIIEQINLCHLPFGEVVEIANFNSLEQIVISGTNLGVSHFLENLKNNFNESYKAIELNVSAPFHCSLMKEAANHLKEILLQINFRPNIFKYISNIDAAENSPNSSPDEIREKLFHQMYQQVQYYPSLKKLESDDQYLFIEVGPSKVLTNLQKRILPKSKILAMDDDHFWNKLEEALC